MVLGTEHRLCALCKNSSAELNPQFRKCMLTHRIHLQGLPTLFFEAGYLNGLQFTKQARLAGHWSPGISSLHPLSSRVTITTLHSTFHLRVLGWNSVLVIHSIPVCGAFHEGVCNGWSRESEGSTPEHQAIRASTALLTLQQDQEGSQGAEAWYLL